MNTAAFDQGAPVIIGGVGGSGTRVVTEMLIQLGYYMGTGNNSAHDNIWFRYLLKRPAWLAACRRNDPKQIEEALAHFTLIMSGRFAAKDVLHSTILQATFEQHLRGAKRFVRLLCAQKPNAADYVGWGWKEPSTHVFLNELLTHYPRMKYIHTIRHGLDMAFTGKLSQIRDWASLFSIPLPASESDLPATLLEFWIRANRRALEFSQRLGSDRFLLMDFDELCRNPAEGTAKLVRFLGVTPDAARIAEAAAVPRTPKSRERYKSQDLSAFSREQLQAVRDFGYEIEGG